MAGHVSVLIFGMDPLLLETRQWVLTASGHTIHIATTLNQVRHHLYADPINLLILCHTLTPAARAQALELLQSRIVRTTNPRVRHLQLIAGVIESPDSHGEVLDAMEGPARLVHAVNELVARPASTFSSHAC